MFIIQLIQLCKVVISIFENEENKHIDVQIIQTVNSIPG